MSDRLVAAMMAGAGRMDSTIGRARWGIVTSVNPSPPSIRVKYQPDDRMSGWIPVLHQSAGGGWSVMSLPTPGQMAFLMPDMGDAQNYVCVGFAHTTQARPAEVPSAAGTGGTVNPTATPLVAGETVLTGPGGQVIRLGPAGIYMRGTVTIDGNLRVNGDLEDKIGKLGLLRTHYNVHTHGETGGNTTTPTPTDP